MLTCVICQQERSTRKKLKTHFLARHSRLIHQIKKLFLKNNLHDKNYKRNRVNNIKNGETKKYGLCEFYRSSCKKNSFYGDKRMKISNEKKKSRWYPNKIFRMDRKVIKQNIVTDNKNSEGTIIKSYRTHTSRDISNVLKDPKFEDLRAMETQNSYSISEVNFPNFKVKNEGKFFRSERESENRRIVFPNSESRMYCNICGNAYNTHEKLLFHLQVHCLECKFVNTQMFNDCNVYNACTNILKVYACYVCASEFQNKSALINHLNAHYEHEVLEGVLDMEQDYNSPKNAIYYCSTNDNLNGKYDYVTAVTHIKEYLFANEQYCFNSSYSYCDGSKDICTKVKCDPCFQELFLCEYENYFRSHYSM